MTPPAKTRPAQSRAARGRPRVHEGREDDVLAVAYRAFTERGYHDTRMEQIARQGRIGHGAMYRYFGTKLDLFKRVVERAATRVAAIVASEQPGAARSLTDYEAQLWRIGGRLEALVDEEPEIVRFVVEEAHGIDPAVDRIVDNVMAAFADFTAEYLRQGKKRGYLRADLDVAPTARLVNAMILEAIGQLGRRSSPAARQAWMRALIRLMLDGVRA
jgi:AcrR family transcriptional regulator